MSERACKCHGEPMQRNPGSNGGWRCAVKQHERRLRHYYNDPRIETLQRMIRANNSRNRRDQEVLDGNPQAEA